MKYAITIIIYFNAQLLLSQNFNSSKYGYKIEIQKNYTLKEATGNNIDFKAVNLAGNSIIIVVKKLSSELKNYTVFDMYSTPKEDYEKSLSEYMPNPKFIKSGLSKLDNKDTYWYHYTSNQANERKMYHINYCACFNGYLYVITCSCLEKDLDLNMPNFIRAIQSFQF